MNALLDKFSAQSLRPNEVATEGPSRKRKEREPNLSEKRKCLSFVIILTDTILCLAAIQKLNKRQTYSSKSSKGRSMKKPDIT